MTTSVMIWLRKSGDGATSVVSPWNRLHESVLCLSVGPVLVLIRSAGVVMSRGRGVLRVWGFGCGVRVTLVFAIARFLCESRRVRNGMFVGFLSHDTCAQFGSQRG